MSSKFQFLMVRLKGRSDVVAVAALSMFQFLMVRLKVGVASACFVYTLFQFLMVRLKESGDEFFHLVLVCFNSLWFD